MNRTSATLTIGGRTFTTGDTVKTPQGTGVIVGLDPFEDAEIGVQFPDQRLTWFSFREINHGEENPS